MLGNSLAARWLHYPIGALVAFLVCVSPGSCAFAGPVSVQFSGGWTVVPSIVREKFGELFDHPFSGSFTYDSVPVAPGTYPVFDSTLVFGGGVEATFVTSALSFANQVRYSTSFIGESYAFTLAVENDVLPTTGSPYLFQAYISDDNVFDPDEPPFELPFLLGQLDEPRGPELRVLFNAVGNTQVGGVIAGIAIVPEPHAIHTAVAAAVCLFASVRLRHSRRQMSAPM